MPYDYSKLSGLIAEKCGSRSIFAREMGLSERTISLKMAGKVSWRQDEMSKACVVLSIAPEQIPRYFFKL